MNSRASLTSGRNPAAASTGAAGTVRMVAIREHRYPFLDKVGNWNRFRRNTGGTLVEKCCHFFDLMNQVMPGPPRRVMASGAQDVCYKDESYGGEQPDIIDNAFAIAEDRSVVDHWPSGAVYQVCSHQGFHKLTSRTGLERWPESRPSQDPMAARATCAIHQPP